MKTTAHAQGLRAFTLIEVMVAVSIFATVMLVATGAVFSIVEANKKAHSLKSVMTNLNFALESMSRDMRVGSQYECSDGSGQGCPNGASTFTYKSNRDINGDGGYDDFDKVVYGLSDSRLMRQVLGGGFSAMPMTAEEIKVTSLRFFHTDTGGSSQPKVTIVVQGYSGTSTTRSDFNIQTTVSQRTSD